jgi:hypothetical protein
VALQYGLSRIQPFQWLFFYNFSSLGRPVENVIF